MSLLKGHSFFVQVSQKSDCKHEHQELEAKDENVTHLEQETTMINPVFQVVIHFY